MGPSEVDRPHAGSLGSWVFPIRAISSPGVPVLEAGRTEFPLCSLADLLRDDDAVCVSHAGSPPAW